MFKQFRFWTVTFLLAGLLLVVAPIAAQTTPPMPLAGRGTYSVGVRLIPLVDASRNDRAMLIAIWYPAIQPDKPDKQQRIMGEPDSVGWLRAMPDFQAARYPLILYSHGLGRGAQDQRDAAVLLASHGYVVVGLDHPDDTRATAFVDRPLDVIFTLNELAAMNTGELAGLIDTENVGFMGDSLGAYTTLLMTGARIDPALAAAVDAKPYDPGNASDPRSLFPDWNWQNLAGYRAPFSLPLVGDEASPLSDLHIRAAVMNSPCLVPLFGEAGAAAATVPALIVGGTSDIICPYEENSLYLFNHLGSPEHYLLSFVKGDHVPGTVGLAASPTNQLLVAFFDYYLKGDKAAAPYLTTDYVASLAAGLKLDMRWDAVTGD